MRHISCIAGDTRQWLKKLWTLIISHRVTLKKVHCISNMHLHNCSCLLADAIWQRQQVYSCRFKFCIVANAVRHKQCDMGQPLLSPSCCTQVYTLAETCQRTVRKPSCLCMDPTNGCLRCPLHPCFVLLHCLPAVLLCIIIWSGALQSCFACSHKPTDQRGFYWQPLQYAHATDAALLTIRYTHASTVVTMRAVNIHV